MNKKPSVKVLHLVNRDKPTVEYLYEAMDRAKEVIKFYYVGKHSLGYKKYIMILNLMDDQWNKMLNHLIHAAMLILNRFFPTHNFDFNGEVMEGFVTSLEDGT
jgi:hypothetical protein